MVACIAFRIIPLLLVIALMVFVLPPWWSDRVAVVVDYEFTKDTNSRVYYSSGAPFARNDFVGCYVRKGRRSVKYELPVAMLRRLRLDFGPAPGTFLIHSVKMLSAEGETRCEWKDLDFNADVTSHGVDCQGRMAVSALKAQSFAKGNLRKDGFRSRTTVSWSSVLLSILLAGLCFSKVSAGFSVPSSHPAALAGENRGGICIAQCHVHCPGAYDIAVELCPGVGDFSACGPSSRDCIWRR